MALSPIGLRYISTGIRPFLAQLTSARRAIGGLATTGQTLGGSFTSIGRTATTAGLGLTFLATIPIATVLGKSAAAAANFETSLVKINTLVGLAAPEVDRLQQGILSLAPALGKLPSELAEAAFFITSSGARDAALALEILEVSAKASALGLGETKVVANAVTSVLQAYGTENITAAEATDTLVGAVQRGKFEADQFAPALGKTLGLAAELGVNFQEASAFIATYSLSGVSASQATTALQRTLTAVIKPSNKANDALAQIGLTIDDVQSSIRDDGLTATLIGLRQTFDAAGIPLANFFGRVTALNGVLFNTGEATDLFIENLNAINNIAGITEQGFSTATQTTNFQIQQLKASLEVLGISIGSVLLPAINQILSRLIPFVLAIADLAAQNPRLVLLASGFLILVAALGPLILTFGLFSIAIGGLISILGGLVSAFLALISPITLVAVAFAGIGVIAAAILSRQFRNLDASFTDIARAALNWGKNITINLAKGIIAGATFVVRALNQLGQVIASWLRPGSPPRLLPDLPEWGASAMNEYLQGFASADFSIFDTLASTIEGFIRSITPESAQIDVVPNIVDARQVLAGIIDAVNELDIVTEGAIRSIVNGFGIADGTIQDYIVTTLRLAEAQEKVKEIQEEINDVNAQFDTNVEPLNEELEAIEARRDEVRRQQRIEVLQGILDDQNAPDLAKELALLELREIELQQQVAAEEDARDAALEALDEKLKAAEEEVAALEEQAKQQEALINAQQKNNDLLKEQAELLKRLAEELDDVADKLGELSGGGTIGGIGGLPEIEGIGEDLTGVLGGGFVGLSEEISATFQEVVDELVSELSGPLDTLVIEFQNLGDTWAEVLTLAAENYLGFLTDYENISSKVKIGLFLLKVGFMTQWADIVQTVSTAGETIATGLRERMVELRTNARASLTLLRTTWSALFDQLKQIALLIFLNIATSIRLRMVQIRENIRTRLNEIKTAVSERLTELKDNFVDTFETTRLRIATKLALIKSTIKSRVTDAKDAVVALKGRFISAGEGLILGLKEGVVNKAKELVAAVSQAVLDAIAAALNILNQSSPSKVFMEIGENTMTGMAIGVMNEANKVADAINGALDPIIAPLVPSNVAAQPVALPAQMVAAQAAASSSQIQIGPITVSNDMDEAIFIEKVRRVVTGDI